MTIVATAPGKLAVLGEYAVLEGAPALVLAVDRRTRVEIDSSQDARCHLHTLAGDDRSLDFEPARGSGVGLIDQVVTRWPGAAARPWRAEVDSRAMFSRGRKLGLGSSAATLTAWAGAWTAFAGVEVPGVADLIETHRAWQAGAGSGLDVAASRFGGLLSYRLGERGRSDIVSVVLPDSVGFVGVCTGQAASTASLVGRFRAWQREQPPAADALVGRMRRIAERGVDAAQANGAADFIAAVAEYGEALDALGKRLGVEIVTAEHRQIAAVAQRFGVAYKISGAGGGDVGIGLATDPAVLGAFAAALSGDFEVLRVGIDPRGLAVEVRQQ